MRKRMSVVSLTAALGISAVILGLAGCSSAGYYWQGFKGQMQIMQAAKPIDDWLTDAALSPALTPALRQRLQTAQQMRRFASQQLALPDNASYTRFAQLQRPFAVWNVVAAPPYSLAMHQWCFPITGCIAYRGYFAKSNAQTEASVMQAQGLETSVYGVPAYSTLGYLNWLGGDPLLSTFIQYPQGELARMIFHELAHQVVYVKDDTAFNESFATAVERLGSTAWLASQANPSVQAEYAGFDARRRAFRALTAKTRQQLQAIYALGDDAPPDAGARETRKRAAYAEFRLAYAQLRQGWGGLGPYDAWVANANNAAFGALAAYDDWVAAFEALFNRQPGDWRAFHAAVRQLAELPRAERTQRLQQLLAEKPSLP